MALDLGKLVSSFHRRTRLTSSFRHRDPAARGGPFGPNRDRYRESRCSSSEGRTDRFLHVEIHQEAAPSEEGRASPIREPDKQTPSGPEPFAALGTHGRILPRHPGECARSDHESRAGYGATHRLERNFGHLAVGFNAQDPIRKVPTRRPRTKRTRRNSSRDCSFGQTSARSRDSLVRAGTRDGATVRSALASFRLSGSHPLVVRTHTELSVDIGAGSPRISSWTR